MKAQDDSMRANALKDKLPFPIMVAQKDLKILTQLLAIEGMIVLSQSHYKGLGVVLKLEAIEKQATCPRCGKKSHRLHQNHRHLVKDLPWGEQQVFLEVNRRQFKCQKCQKPFSEEFDWLERKRNFTNRLAHQTVKEVLEKNIESVARKGVVTTAEIERMLKDAALKMALFKPIDLRRLGIDEIALVKGKGSDCAVLVNLETGELLAILVNRKKAEIQGVLESWGAEVLSQIEEVSIDLWKGYRSLVEELMPNAQVVADRFHVMSQINQELDRQRKKEKWAAEATKKSAKSVEAREKDEPKLAALKESKYALLKNEEDLKPEQKEKLEAVKAAVPILKEMQELKEEIRHLFDEAKNWLEGLLGLSDWLLRARVYFKQSTSTISRWRSEIVAYFDNRTTSGVVEGINNKLKLIKRSGYGFRNFSNFQTRCWLTWHYC